LEKLPLFGHSLDTFEKAIIAERVRSLFRLIDAREGSFAAINYIGVDDFLAEPFVGMLRVRTDAILEAFNEYRSARVLRGEVSKESSKTFAKIMSCAERWALENNYLWLHDGFSRAEFKQTKEIRTIIKRIFLEYGIEFIDSENSRSELLVRGKANFDLLGPMAIRFRLSKTELGRLTFGIFRRELQPFDQMFELRDFEVSASWLYQNAKLIFPGKYSSLQHDNPSFDVLENCVRLMGACVQHFQNGSIGPAAIS
jgi:hypothetical protein